MSNQWIDLSSCQSLAVLVESVTSPLLIEHPSPVCLELDIDTDIPIPADPQKTADLVRALVHQSLQEMPGGGDLTVTACKTQRGIELEIADTGCDIEERPTRLPMVAVVMGASIVWQNCPQGGAAATIAFRTERGQKRMAA